jgi:hypothetical protein
MFFKRKTTRYPATLWEKLYAPVMLFIGAIVGLIALNIEKGANDFFYPLKKVNLDAPVPISFSTKVDISSSAIIRFKDVPFLKTFLYPDKYFITDRFYLLFAMLICSVIIYLIYYEHKKGVFNTNVLKYTKALTIVFTLMFTLNFFRWRYVQNQIADVTSNEYRLFTTLDQFYRPEFWLMVALGIITYILKKGERLQNEQDLTI